MEIGRLSSQVTLQSPPSGQDAQGQSSGAWTDVATTWADIRHDSGLSAIRGGADLSIVKASIRIRARTDIAQGWRVALGSGSYIVRAVLPAARHRYVDLVCELVQ